MSSTERDTLERQEAELLAIINTPTEKELAARKLIDVQTQRAEQRKRQELDDAKARMTAIAREFAGQLTEQPDDDKRIVAARKALSAANERKNNRYRRFMELAHEARTLNKTYGIPVPEFASLKSNLVPLPAVALREVPEPVALLDGPDVARIMREIAGAAPDVARDDKLTAELDDFRGARLAAAHPRDLEQEARKRIPGNVGY